MHIRIMIAIAFLSLALSCKKEEAPEKEEVTFPANLNVNAKELIFDFFPYGDEASGKFIFNDSKGESESFSFTIPSGNVPNCHITIEHPDMLTPDSYLYYPTYSSVLVFTN